ncbi:hypothetical protein HanIR_Chr03g0120631 [Helianthus annuus]|nr:hypothetical protein HanIR_Chr03g0120631 [Helianthus annuus]
MKKQENNIYSHLYLLSQHFLVLNTQTLSSSIGVPHILHFEVEEKKNHAYLRPSSTPVNNPQPNFWFRQYSDTNDSDPA